MYVYLVSHGEYSDYGIEAVLLHERKFSKEELEDIIRDVKVRYTIKMGAPGDHYIDSSVLNELFFDAVEEKGFVKVLESGEIHLNGKLDDISAYVPWNDSDREASALRQGMG